MGIMITRKNKHLLAPPPPKLKNKRVLVIGDQGRAQKYKDVVMKHGATSYDFLDGIDHRNRIRAVLGKSIDLVFFVTAYAKHGAFEQMKACLPITTKVVYVNQNSISGLEQAIIGL